MLRQKLLARRRFIGLGNLIKQIRCSSQLSVETAITGSWSEKRLLPAHKPKQPTREPFMKNLCIGRFDVEFLTYPEAQTRERHREFFEWLKAIEDYIQGSVDAQKIDLTSKVEDEIFEELQKLGVLRAAVDESYGGLGLTSSEYAKLVETVSLVPVLGTYLTKRAMVVELIMKYGNEQQKSDLLPKIAAGEIEPAICISEGPSGATSEPFKSKATLTNCSNFYTLNAQKTWVFNATKANMFVLLVSNVSPDPYITATQVSAFVIPSNVKGITIEEPATMFGQHGIDLCTVNFNDIQIPLDATLGTGIMDEEMLVSALSSGKLNTGAQAIGILKNFLNHLTTSIVHSQGFNSKRHEEDSKHNIVGRIACDLYAMEAMVYLTAGMSDTFENQDTSLEKSLIESYCASVCIEAICTGIQALGTSGCLMNQPFEKIIRDALPLITYDRSAMDTKIFAALMGLQYSGKILGQSVLELRNPLFHPIQMMKLAIKLDWQTNFHLAESLHPSLQIAATSLEMAVNKLKRVVETLLVRYGATLLQQRMDLKRLTDMMIQVYMMTAIVARASRSYCTGLRNSEQEVKIAMTFTYQTVEKINSIVTELIDSDWSNGDLHFKDIADSMFQKKSYFASHPMERNI